MILQSSERFQNDVKNFTEIIDKLPDDQRKLEAKKLLNDLIFEVKKMDNMYLDMVYSRQLPSMGNEFRDKISSIRKQLDSKLKSV